MNTAAATLNVIIITDPTGQDPNGAAAGSMSFAPNMFQSTFIFSPEHNFAVLSGGSEDNETARLAAIVETIKRLEDNSTPSNAVTSASAYKGIRIMAGGPTIGAAVGGDFDAYVVTVAGDGTITVTPYSKGVATLPAGTKGAIIHLRHTDGNPIGGNVSAVRQSTAIMIGQEIRDGHPATKIMGDVFEKVSIEAGEKYGGGAVNLVSDISTGDAFTPQRVNETGFPMDQPYSKTDPKSEWSIAYPAAESYTVSPINGNPLKIIYAYDALRDIITVQPHNVTVYVYGADTAGVSTTAKEIVTSSVSETGFSADLIAKDINSAIDGGLLLGVNHVEPKDINVRQNSKEVGVYFTSLPEGRTSPPWDLPISSSLLDIIGNLQTALGLILIILVLFRSTLITSFTKKRR
ncbi:MAG: hypothetical protein LLF83_06170 [Methanobacterium sp.]|nr:hypothetical protein [Methanobacterium sp.]